MLGILALLLVAVVVCVRLGAWQIDRAYATSQAAAQVHEQELAQATAVSIAEVLEPGAHLMGRDVGRPVTVTGTFEPELQVLVPGRSIGGEVGSLVVTPLRVTAGAEGQPWLTVVRGFVPDGESLTQIPQAPAGEVSVLGTLGGAEAYVPRALPQGQVPSLAPAYFANTWGLPIYDAYFVAAPEDPASAGLATVPRPSVSAEAGANLRNLAYAAEWFVFAGFALVVWFRLVRDEALDRREDALAAAA